MPREAHIQLCCYQRANHYSGWLQASFEAFSVKVEPAPDVRNADFLISIDDGNVLPCRRGSFRNNSSFGTRETRAGDCPALNHGFQRFAGAAA
jgi:hypothetical protein